LIQRVANTNTGGGSGVDESALNEIHERINNLANELDNLRNEFSKWLKDIQDQLNNKADLNQLGELERSLMERFDNIVKGLVKQLADKNDTKKALKLLERQLKNLYDLFVSRGGAGDNEDEAMFTKK
jgi:archaellum component FlaC